MIHKFVANDNKGNVNILEVTSTGTKLGKVAPPVEDTDVATKKYVDDNAGGSSLPSVTSSDNGKVLGVVDGDWAADSNFFLVTITSLNPDKTNAEIESAYLSGKNVYALYSSNYYRLEFANSTRADFALIKQDTFSIQKIKIENGHLYAASAASLPNVTQSDNGAEAIVKNGIWAKQQKKFVVTLTPTALDYSGTMDKTPQEITAAYNAGQKIVFDIPTMNAMVDADQYVASGTSVNNLRFGAKVFFEFNNAPVLITIITNGADDAQTYLTGIYTLTPAS